MTPSDGAYAGMTRLEPGVYDDGRGGMHVDLEEMLEANGFEPTVEAKRRLREAIARGGAREGIPVEEIDHAASMVEARATHDRARQEAIAVIDTEQQRLATVYMEQPCGAPVREQLFRRVKYLSGLIDRLIGWR